MNDPETYRAAAAILKRYRTDDAALFCAHRADAMLDAGDLVSRQIWQRIQDAVRELTRGPEDGDAVH